MNKKIKRIIAMTLALGAFASVGQIKGTNFFTTKVYASNDDADELTDIELNDSDGDSIDLYEDSDYDTELDDDLDVGETYYATTSATKIVIDSIDGADEDNVRIFKASTEYEVGDSIKIGVGVKTTLKVRVYEDEYDEDEDYSSSDYNQYTIVVENEDEDDINLSSLELSDGDIDFDEDRLLYNVVVDSDVDDITITAEPEDDDYTVTIDGTTVDSDDDYEEEVSLDDGMNIIKVKITDDDDNAKTYILNINKGSVTTQGTTGMQGGQGGMQGGQGGMQGGQGGIQGSQSAMQGGQSATQVTNKGWVSDSNSWYYYDDNGNMKTGWFQDTDGKWYYFLTSGIMASNTTINGYTLGSNGAWVA
jgi:hypothetical protein